MSLPRTILTTMIATLSDIKSDPTILTQSYAGAGLRIVDDDGRTLATVPLAIAPVPPPDIEDVVGVVDSCWLD